MQFHATHLLLIVLAFVAVSCSVGSDDAPPEILADSFVLLTPDEEGNFTINALSEGASAPGPLLLEVELEDDQMLLEMKVELANTEEPLPGNANIFPQALNFTYPVRGNSIVASKTLTLPNSLASGVYLLSFQIEDEVGNVAALGPFDVAVENDLPIISLDVPTEDSLLLAPGASVQLIGLVEANSKLAFDIEMNNLDTAFLLGQFTDLPSVYFFNETFNLADTLLGEYTLTLHAKDSIGGESSLPLKLNIDP